MKLRNRVIQAVIWVMMLSAIAIGLPSTAPITAQEDDTLIDPDSYENDTLPLPVGSDGDWQMTFSDEFNAEALNNVKWNDQWGAPGSYWGPPNTVRWSEEWMLPENVNVEDGLLRLRHQIQDDQITAGVITTNGKFTQQYGFFEARLRANETPGVVSAFWLQYDPDHWPPEIDIVEILANDWTAPRMTIHYAYPGHQHASYRYVTDTDFTADFHVFGLEWNANELIFYVDGEPVHTRSNPGGDFDLHEMYVQLNMHSGNGFSGYPPQNGNASFMEVDYVRVWQYANADDSQAASEVPQGFVSVNQVGYIPGQTKLAAFPRSESNSDQLPFQILEVQTNNVVFEGLTAPTVRDRAAEEYVHLLDFSEFNTAGTYIISIDGIVSVPFGIRTDIYSALSVDAVKFFYHNRVGIPIELEYVGQEQWTRPAGHVTDNAVTCFKGRDTRGTEWPGCDYTLDVSGGWYDAGDFGKYVVNGGITTWTLANIYEFLPTAFGDGTLNIPESGNGFPDILDEARWEMEWMLRMQVPVGHSQAGMAHHKMHNVRWDPVPTVPPTEWNNDNDHTSDELGRYLMPPSTAATLNLAATAAQCARIWADLDPQFAERCLSAAETAWNAAHDNPIFVYGDIPGNGGGPYNDHNVDDEFFWAAAELYVTTGSTHYYDFLKSSPYFDNLVGWTAGAEGAIGWGSTAMLGKITLATAASNLPQAEREQFRAQIITVANSYVEVTNAQGYRMPMVPDGYSWGSNSVVLNNALLMAYAYDFTNEQQYLNSVVMAMDYILGRNALNFSFVSGYGTHTLAHPHHRFWADRDVPPGAVAGGPNAYPSDPPAEDPTIRGQAPAKRYIDDIGSWSTNEVAINWNAPLAWITAFLNAHTRT